MPRPTRAQKDARKARAEAFKASETSTTRNNNNNNNGTPASNCAPCGIRSVLVSAGGETRVLTLGESKQENATESNASAVVQDKRAEKGTAEIGKERSDGVERPPGENKHQKVNEVNAFTVVQNKRVEKNMAEIAKERSCGGERGPLRKSGEEEAVSLRPSQLESRQKQRDDRSSFAENKGFRQDYNDRNSSASQNYEGFNSRQGEQHGYNDNRWRGRGGDSEGDSRRIDALGRLFYRLIQNHDSHIFIDTHTPRNGERVKETEDDDAPLERSTYPAHISPLLPSSTRVPSHDEHGKPSRAAATVPPASIPTTVFETPITSIDLDWREGDPIGTQGWREFVSRVIIGMVSSTGTQRLVGAGRGPQHGAGRHKDIFEPVAQLRVEHDYLQAEVERARAERDKLHRENVQLMVEAAELRGIVRGIEIQSHSRSHSRSMASHRQSFIPQSPPLGLEGSASDHA